MKVQHTHLNMNPVNYHLPFCHIGLLVYKSHLMFSVLLLEEQSKVNLTVPYQGTHFLLLAYHVVYFASLILPCITYLFQLPIYWESYLCWRQKHHIHWLKDFPNLFVISSFVLFLTCFFWPMLNIRLVFSWTIYYKLQISSLSCNNYFRVHLFNSKIKLLWFRLPTCMALHLFEINTSLILPLILVKLL